MAWMRGVGDTVEGEYLPQKKIHGYAAETKAALVLGAEGMNG
jgi:hypothetical protein